MVKLVKLLNQEVIRKFLIMYVPITLIAKIIFKKPWVPWR